MNNINREQDATCMYCLREVGKDIDAVAAVYKWDKENEIVGWFCRNHYRQVQNFEDEQRRRFISYYQHKKTWLSEDQQRLYNRLKREV